ncbi:MAG: SH3 domain-containing protein [Lachnospiraceae bacterium]|nr:SH3 domain-containing protein [Lachnospiraceae bacterium]
MFRRERIIYRTGKDHSRELKLAVCALTACVIVLLIVLLLPRIGGMHTGRSFAAGEETGAAETAAPAAETSAADTDGTPAGLRALLSTQGASLVRSGLSAYFEPVNEEFANVLIADVENFLNVRAAADEEGEIVGYLYRGDSGEIIEQEGNWYHITSGNVDGWVAGDYVAVGNDAAELAAEICDVRAVIQTDGLNVREDASGEAEVLCTVSTGERYIVLDQTEDGWVQIEYADDGSSGYVSADYVELSMDLGTALTVEEAEAIAEAEREAARQAAEAAVAAEAAAAAEAQAAAQAQAAPQPTQQAPTSANYDEVYLLACICRVEAINYEGMIAVANCVINRVNHPSYPNTITEVIYQPGQFAVGSRFQSYLANGPGSTAIDAANAALGGQNLIGGLLNFGATWAGHTGFVVGDNAFY